MFREKYGFPWQLHGIDLKVVIVVYACIIMKLVLFKYKVSKIKNKTSSEPADIIRSIVLKVW